MNAESIKHAIAAALPCEHLEVRGDGQHWFATIVSAAFEGQRALARHRLVYAALDEQLRSEALHALSMQTYTPAEYEKLANS